MPIKKCENREEWLIDRRTSIGASDTPIVMGQSPYKAATQLKLYTDKLGPFEEDKERPEFMEWGHKLEPLIAQKLADVTGFDVVDPGDFAIFRNEATPFMHATPDRRLLDPSGEHDGEGVGELKAPGSHFTKQWTEGPPLGVEIQIQAEMHSTGASWGAVAALIGGQTFKWKIIERNQPFIDELVKKCQEFWTDHVISKVPPEAEAGDLALLGRMYPEQTKGLTVECDELMMRHVDEYDIIAAELKREAAALAYHEARIKKYMNVAEFLQLKDGSAFTWKNQPKKAYEVKASNPRVFRRKAAPKK